MVAAAVALLAFASPQKGLETKVESASLFKNGYAVVVREAKFSGSGTYTLTDLPQAVLGTFWITANAGTKLSEVVVSTLEEEVERSAQSMDEVLNLNQGKRLRFTTYERTVTVDGILRSSNGSIVVIERLSKDGSKTDTWVAPKGAILEISSPDGDFLWKLKEKRQRRVIRFKANAAGNGSIILVGLERGLTWAPAYMVDISDAKKLRLISKATILNDLADLDDIQLKLVTGFPNVPYINIWDPFTSQQVVDQWVGALMQAGTPDQYRAREGFAGQMAANARLAERDFADVFTTSPLPGQQEEDLFFYQQPNVTLKRGDRGYYVLFTADSDYEHVYEWSIADQIRDTTYVEQPEQSEDVWHSLKFKNTSGRPFTTAAAITMKAGELLGQDMMRYTTAGADATVRITKAMDVAAEAAEEETGRVVESLKLRSGYYDLVTLKGTLRIVNRKGNALKLKITKYLTGVLKSADLDPKVTALAKGLRAINPRLRLEWTIDLKAGEKKELNYTYTVYINR